MKIIAYIVTNTDYHIHTKSYIDVFNVIPLTQTFAACKT